MTGKGETADFPELYPLCAVREVAPDGMVCFCWSWQKADGVCSFHQHMRKAGHGKWDGLEVLTDPDL